MWWQSLSHLMGQLLPFFLNKYYAPFSLEPAGPSSNCMVRIFSPLMCKVGVMSLQLLSERQKSILGWIWLFVIMWGPWDCLPDGKWSPSTHRCGSHSWPGGELATARAAFRQLSLNCFPRSVFSHFPNTSAFWHACSVLSNSLQPHGL